MLSGILAIIIAIFAFARESKTPPTYDDYEQDIKCLNDTIKSLKDDIKCYKLEVERIEIEREKIREALNNILEHNEKTDSELANGDWDTNVRFLTEFLSKEDSVGK